MNVHYISTKKALKSLEVTHNCVRCMCMCACHSQSGRGTAMPIGISATGRTLASRGVFLCALAMSSHRERGVAKHAHRSANCNAGDPAFRGLRSMTCAGAGPRALKGKQPGGSPVLQLRPPPKCTLAYRNGPSTARRPFRCGGGRCLCVAPHSTFQAPIGAMQEPPILYWNEDAASPCRRSTHSKSFNTRNSLSLFSTD